MENIRHILQLEDQEDFDEAFALYKELYERNSTDFEIWKHFYFFLWIAIEDASSEFHDRINLRQRLRKMYKEGQKSFQNLTEFKFIAGWTVSIFPYEYGDYEDLESQGKELLRQAHQEDPDDKVYKMAYLGSLASKKDEYKKAEIEAGSEVLKRFQGPGLLNRYFIQVLGRKNETPK